LRRSAGRRGRAEEAYVSLRRSKQSRCYAIGFDAADLAQPEGRRAISGWKRLAAQRNAHRVRIEAAADIDDDVRVGLPGL
jgi:hypothetical protein